MDAITRFQSQNMESVEMWNAKLVKFTSVNTNAVWCNAIDPNGAWCNVIQLRKLTEPLNGEW